MLKDTIISLLSAALIQPAWSQAITWWEIMATYGITFSAVFTLIVDLEDWIERRRYRRWRQDMEERRKRV